MNSILLTSLKSFLWGNLASIFTFSSVALTQNLVWWQPSAFRNSVANSYDCIKLSVYSIFRNKSLLTFLYCHAFVFYHFIIKKSFSLLLLLSCLDQFLSRVLSQVIGNLRHKIPYQRIFILLVLFIAFASTSFRTER